MGILINTHFCEIPFFVAERTHGTRFQPALDAVQVKDMPAVPKRDAETIVVGRGGIGLVLDRRLVEGIAANGALNW